MQFYLVQRVDKRTVSKRKSDEISVLTLSPPSGGQGTSMVVRFDGSASAFTYNDTSSVDFGSGISVLQLNIEDGWNATADIQIEPEAELGSRDVVVATGKGTYVLEQSFSVVSDSLIIEPNSAKMGEVVEIGILGTNTDWQSGVSWYSSLVTVLKCWSSMSCLRLSRKP